MKGTVLAAKAVETQGKGSVLREEVAAECEGQPEEEDRLDWKKDLQHCADAAGKTIVSSSSIAAAAEQSQQHWQQQRQEEEEEDR